MAGRGLMEVGRRMLMRLSSRQLFGFLLVLLVVDMLVPDPLPFVDEAILMVLTFLAARRQPGDEEMSPGGQQASGQDASHQPVGERPPMKNVTPPREQP